MAIDYHLLYDAAIDHRTYAINLLQECIGERTCNNYKLTQRMQTIDYCQRIATIAPDAQEELEKTLNTYTSLATLPTLQNRLPRTLNSDRSKITITPFIGFGNDPVNLLNRCFKAALSYYNCTDAQQAPSSLDFARTTLQETLDHYNRSPTVFGNLIADKLQRIAIDIEQHFKASPYGKPARIDLTPRPRRYPLHIPDRDIPISLELRNFGEGVAVTVEVSLTDAIGLVVPAQPLRLSNVHPGSMIIEIPARTTNRPEHNQQSLCTFHLWWMNADGTESEERDIDFDLDPQDPSIDWDQITLSNPYSLDAVTTNDELIGRSNMIRRIVSTLNTTTGGSLYIYGEKRVGKTSLALVALEFMRRQDATCIFRDIGAINHSDPAQAINNLTERLAEDIARQIPSLSAHTSNLNLDGSLASLNRLLESATELGARIVIALDEFDQLPVQLFGRTNEGGAFFSGLRSISTIPGICLLLIAGERMKLIINGAGVYLNRFAPFPVDYLDRAAQWPDFQDLVRKPTEGSLDFTAEACTRIYEYTQGNPYYTKHICSVVLENASDRRDSFVNVREIEAAIKILLTRIDQTSFSHYWEDFLLEEDEDTRDEVSLNRRRLLLAFGLGSTSDSVAPLETVIEKAATLGLEAERAQREIDGFVSRGFLTTEEDSIHPRIRLFGRWIVSKGRDDIILTPSEREAARPAIQEREQMEVTLSAAESLVEPWSVYNGLAITGQRVLEYLEQFGGVHNQRLVFSLLKQIRFIGDAEEAKLMREAYKHLEDQMAASGRRWKREDIRISYCGPVGRSGSAMARSFAKANGFIRDSRGILGPRSLRSWASKGVSDVVIVDDFVGTGNTLERQLQEVAKHIPTEQEVHVFVAVGMTNGMNKVTASAKDIFGEERVNVQCILEVDSHADPFSAHPGAFSSPEEADDARRLVMDFGNRLERNIPFGYGDCCALVTFSRTIPNNAPPILWSSSRGEGAFKPLFPRN